MYKSSSTQDLDVVALRQSLSDFQHAEAFQSSELWIPYLKMYKLAPLLEQYRLRLGVVSCEAYELVVQHYMQATASRGTVILVHGYMDHVGLYSQLISEMLGQGWNVLCYDLPGHGLSNGDSYAIDHFSRYAEQLEGILQQSVFDKPCVMVGQSTGGAIVLAHQKLFASKQAIDPITQRILLAPLIRPVQYHAIYWKYAVLRFLLKRIRRFHSKNSHSEDFLRFIRSQDPLQKQWVAVNWVGAMLEWVDLIESSEPQSIAITLIQGTDDGTVDWQHNLAVLQRLFPDIDVELVEDGRHHLANEGLPWRQQVFDKISEVLMRL
ncbi:alpha/beta hydrolase [Neptunomonas japonica]|uniref:alpha/beta hydrolase n=1 Tax=Neptunomonas japonica TaxID=417574 RepID=UPI001F42D8D0|nr:alpha/beta hydrolase [Neptunomonas japonica]